MKIFICDDRQPELIRDAIEEARGAGVPIPEPEKTFGKDQLEGAVAELFGAVESAFANKDIPAHAFDGADLILLDYGLTDLKIGAGPRLTADHIAGYLRAFSDSLYVISLNRLPSVDFDLKYLIGDFETRADLALNTPHLGEPGLWTGKPAAGRFCPWYWPNLRSAAELRMKQIALIEADPDRPILDALSFPDEMIPHLSRQAIAFLSPDAEDTADPGDQHDIRKVSFWNHFQRSNRSLPRDDRALLSGGEEALLQSKCPGNGHLRKVVARVVAGELDFWFRRDILGPQKVLVDSPHLQAQLRFRTDNGASDPDTWSRTAYEPASPFGLDPAIVALIPQRAIYAETPWLDRPAFWLPLIEADDAFEAFAEDATRNSELVFCEDTRRFRSRTESKRFVTELTKGLDVRFVEDVNGFEYSPKSLFAR